MGQVPAATRALRVLRYLAGQPDPVTLDRLAAAVGLPRSTAYHLVDGDDRGGLRRPPARRAPLRPRGRGLRGRQRLRPPGAAAADHPPAPRRRSSTRSGRARTSRCCTAATCSTSWRSARPAGRRWSPTSASGCPAHLTASGRAVLARAAGRAGARALPGPDGVRRPARRRARRRSARCARCSSETRQRGYAVEEGEVTPGLRLGRRGRCSTTTSTRSPGSRSPTPSRPAVDVAADGRGHPPLRRRADPPARRHAVRRPRPRASNRRSNRSAGTR